MQMEVLRVLDKHFYDIYKLKNNSNNIFCIVNQSFESVSHLISHSKYFISCHGAFTHIAANFNIKQIDIINSNKEHHYQRITSSIDNIKSIRDSLSKSCLLSVKAIKCVLFLSL